MEWLNYHHLHYFWLVAREGTIARASQLLRLAEPTVSGQVKALEESLGEQLFQRRGGRLVLTDVGRMVFRYADEIFTTGKELQEAIKGKPGGRPLRLRVGISDVVPKLVAYRLLEPALGPKDPVQLSCVEDKTDRLLAELSTHELDLVIADAPIGPGTHVRAFNHLLGECGVTFFATRKLSSQLSGPFPKRLDGAPILMPVASAQLRRDLERFFDTAHIRPRMVAEFEDSALMKVFGEQGRGVFPGPSVIEREIRDHYDVVVVGRTEDIRERYYAITVERRIKHPAVQAISEAARERLFGPRR